MKQIWALWILNVLAYGAVLRWFTQKLRDIREIASVRTRTDILAEIKKYSQEHDKVSMADILKIVKGDK
jgi:hypothetical protein